MARLHLPLLAITLALALAAPAQAGVFDFSSSQPISAPPGGNGNPFPSAIGVAGLPNERITRVYVKLFGVTNQDANDFDIAIERPSSFRKSSMLLSDAGGPGAVSNATLIFDGGDRSDPDANPPPPAKPTSSPLVSGMTYGAQGSDSDNFTAGGPTSFVSLGSLYSGSGNGQWKLWVRDDESDGNGGSLNGWSLRVETKPFDSGPDCPGIVTEEDVCLPAGQPCDPAGTDPCDLPAAPTLKVKKAFKLSTLLKKKGVPIEVGVPYFGSVVKARIERPRKGKKAQRLGRKTLKSAKAGTNKVKVKLGKKARAQLVAALVTKKKVRLRVRVSVDRPGPEGPVRKKASFVVKR